MATRDAHNQPARMCEPCNAFHDGPCASACLSRDRDLDLFVRDQLEAALQLDDDLPRVRSRLRSVLKRLEHKS